MDPHDSVVSTIPSAHQPAASDSLGARLAAASRQAQGFAPAVSDPVVLAELRELCAAPRAARRAVVVERECLAP